MWGAFNALAEKAKAAAADLEDQLNESVGVVAAPAPLHVSAGADSSAAADSSDNVWNDDDFDFDEEEEEHPQGEEEEGDEGGGEKEENDEPPGAVEELPHEKVAADAADAAPTATAPPPPAAPRPSVTADPVASPPEEASSEQLEMPENGTSVEEEDAHGSGSAPPPPEKEPGGAPDENEWVGEEDDDLAGLDDSAANLPEENVAVREESEDIPPAERIPSPEVTPDAPVGDTWTEPPAEPTGPRDEENDQKFVAVSPAACEHVASHDTLSEKNAVETTLESSSLAELETEPAARDDAVEPQADTFKEPDSLPRNQQEPPMTTDSSSLGENEHGQNPQSPKIASEPTNGETSHAEETSPAAPAAPVSNGQMELHRETEPFSTANSTTMDKLAPDVHSSSAELAQLLHDKEAELERYRQSVDDLRQQLSQRESQLVSKTEQLTSIQNMFESEKQELVQMVEHTKTEAKRRIQIAKDRVEKAEAQAAQLKSGQSDDAQKQAQIIAELRSEGEKLALKQAEMEKAVRSAKGDARNLREALEMEQHAKETALESIESLKLELKSTKDMLVAARKGESQATKLEAELQSAREDAERKASSILSYEQKIKELKAELKEQMKELEAARKGAAMESEREQKKLRKEQSNLIDDFETKLRHAEKEAAVREDALRQEVSELRKRWQDAVRRADTLSMDVQSSTAPLMRQLESMERQNRARAAAWTEMETKLREELEETVIDNEKLSKETTEMKTKLLRLERSNKENASDLRQARVDLEEKTLRVKELEDRLQNMEEEASKQKKEWAEVERLANEGVARVRSEMSQTMFEADERHRSQIDSLKADLRLEREKRTQLEQEVQDLVNKAGSIVPVYTPSPHMHHSNSVPTRKLRNSEGQAEILAGALNLSGMSDDEMEEDSDSEDMVARAGSSSFAALEELTSRLKSTKIELNTLRKSLEESEKNRAKLMEELSEARSAREKLPLFEARVQSLTAENEELSLEVAGLQEDIADVRELYRNQLNALLEEKAALQSQQEEAYNEE